MAKNYFKKFVHHFYCYFKFCTIFFCLIFSVTAFPKIAENTEIKKTSNDNKPSNTTLVNHANSDSILTNGTSVKSTLKNNDQNKGSSAKENNSSANSLALAALSTMQDAVLNSDYQVYLVSQDAEEFSNTFQYRHIKTKKNDYANLLYLEGVSKEIILHNNIVSYFQSESVPFSLSAKRIIEAFPDVIYSNFAQLTDHYDVVLLGKSRTANRSCQIIRIVPKEKDRYNYVIWLDDESHLPLRIDLLDLDSVIIKQVKTLALDKDFDKVVFKNYIEDRDYPVLISIDKENHESVPWSVNWVPKGFKENANYNLNYYQSDISTKLFSDGIFSFTVNISETSEETSPKVFKEGSRSIFSVNHNNINVVVIGDLPAETIKRIAQSVKTKG